ncbi:cellulose biosynthesis protein BcsE [Paraburkholderia atlantica]|uniref:cellulose biosynthesis protein BcsE n=1 Tax=Paraburkholderia atlantica TaxID=2654982 RepID=UPI001610DA3A|nr:cellulose biosynthesis protein BcsE [Paraburkholderia atlantica]
MRRWLRMFGGTGAQRRAQQVGRLAIEALPDAWAALEAGKLYAIYAAPRAPGVDTLIWESARTALTRDVTVVLARERAAVAQRLRELGFTADAPAAGWPRNLNVLAMPGVDRAQESEQQAGSAATHGKLFGGLRALKRFGFRAGALYFIEGAERWFNWHDAAALAREGRMLANWCAARRITLVLLLGVDGNGEDDSFETRGAPDGVIDASRRNAFHAACAGVARMERTHGELLWHADFWRADRTLVTGEVRSLRFTDSGHLSVAPDAPDGNVARGERLLARDEQRVVVSRAVVRGHEAWLPPHWEVCADQAAVLSACAHAQAATVVLDYAGGAQLDALCATVHALRRQAGRALKIVVVERGEVLRHQYELLVLTLGANLVLGRDLPFSRMQSLLQSLQGQLHTRPVAADYRSALSAALSDDVRGYLPAGAFCERVRLVLARSGVLQLPHVLVKLTLLPQCAHVDVLKHCVPRRAGDVLTVDASHLYVFLFACRLADADAALARIIDVPVEQLADTSGVDTLVHLAEQSIGAELDALDAANRRNRIADYSDMFAASMRDGAPSMRDGAPSRSSLAAAQDEAAHVAAVQLARVEEALVNARAELEADTEVPTSAAAPTSARTRPAESTEAEPLATERRPAQPTPPRRRAEPSAMPVRARSIE